MRTSPVKPKLSQTDHNFLGSLGALVAHDFVKKHKGKRVEEVEVELAEAVRRTATTCLEAKL
jgi:hypothetical protein